jgi:hypothetical protein
LSIGVGIGGTVLLLANENCIETFDALKSDRCEGEGLSARVYDSPETGPSTIEQSRPKRRALANIDVSMA